MIKIGGSQEYDDKFRAAIAAINRADLAAVAAHLETFVARRDGLSRDVAELLRYVIKNPDHRLALSLVEWLMTREGWREARSWELDGHGRVIDE